MRRESAPTRRIAGPQRPRGPDAAIAELAGAQHGVVARRQLIELGLGEDAIDHRLRRGRLHRLHRGVYAVGHRAVGRMGWWMAAALAGGPDAVLSHRSAAALWGIRRSAPDAAEITVPGPTRSSPRIRRHRAEVADDERGMRWGISVTTAARTVWDLAATSAPEQVEVDLRQLEFLHLHDRTPLTEILDRYPGRRGARRVRVALDRLRTTPAGRTASPLEERFLSFLDRHDLPRPRLNAWIDLPDRRIQVDCLWPAQRQVIELDGWEGHGTRSAFRDDRARDRHLRVAGYGVTRLALAQLEDEPTAIAADLRLLLAAAGHRQAALGSGPRGQDRQRG